MSARVSCERQMNVVSCIKLNLSGVSSRHVVISVLVCLSVCLFDCCVRFEHI